MFKTLSIAAIAALTLTSGAFAAGGGDQHIENIDFSFDGPFGKFDQNQLQRGLQVYTEVCAACHGLPEDQVRAYASENFEVYDDELEDFREATPVDHFPENNGAGAPDLSMMAKARAGFHGPYGLGGGWISMAPPLYGEDVDFNDGHANDLEHIAEDVSAFLMWTAEPKMMARKQAGFVSVFFLTILSVLLYLTNKRIWAPVKGKGRKES